MRRGHASGLPLLAILACGTIAPPAGSPAPLNTCGQDSDCAAYAQGGPTLECVDGQCQVPPTVGNWTAVISLPQAASNDFAGLTYAFPINTLLGLSPATTSSSTAGCVVGSCVQLPFPTSVTGELECENSAAVAANWNLGGITVDLPVKATFRPVLGGQSSVVDATSVGLPVPAVDADIVSDMLAPAGALMSPGGGPPIEFTVAQGLPPLVAPMTYERTLQPLPPFDRAFPPDISLFIPGTTPNNALFNGGFDATNGTGGIDTFPTFTFSRADGGSLDGWTAYLRDQTTLRPISPIAILTGTEDADVQLLTSHHPQPVNGVVDALNDAQLLVVPPASSPLPTWVFTPFNGLLAASTYPRLPPAVTTSVSVVTMNNAPASADLIFDAVDLCRYNGASLVHDVQSANHDFTFVLRTPHGSGPVQVTLPLGIYRVTAIPVDADAALTVDPDFKLAGNSCNVVQPSPIQLAQKSTVVGSASLANGRPLAEATVQFAPTACMNGDVDPACMPRPQSTTTTLSGAFTVPMDPGAYRVSVMPAAGTAWPWKVETLSVGPTTTTMMQPVVISAPVDLGLRFFDSASPPNPIGDALVRIYENSSVAGVSYEIGEAVTDATGQLDLYLDLSNQ